jgi:hypothetical protein
MNKPKIKGLENLKSAGSNLQVSNDKIEEKKLEFSKDNNITFAFTLPITMIAYLKELVIHKLSSDYGYNESSAVREGLKLLQEASPFVKQRPEDIGVSTKRGRKSTADKEIKKKSTSFLISEADLNFIYNFIYYKQKSGSIFIKEELFSLIIEQLENKYKIQKNNK